MSWHKKVKNCQKDKQVTDFTSPVSRKIEDFLVDLLTQKDEFLYTSNIHTNLWPNSNWNNFNIDNPRLKLAKYRKIFNNNKIF